jgi:hypothetical protein
MRGIFDKILHPIPKPEEFATGLQYTDILFGFVFWELFRRLQNWTELDGASQWHLIVGFTLVLGSWIGFRRSLNRPLYQLKFFNLSLIRFLLDQLMLILYFRIAVLTPAPEVGTVIISRPEAASNLAHETVKLVFLVFVLYAVWDLLGMWMAKAKIKTADGNVAPRYPVVKDGTKTDERQSVNWEGISITVGCLLLLGALWSFAECLGPFALFLATTVLLLAYRWFKEIRTSCQLLRRAQLRQRT